MGLAYAARHGPGPNRSLASLVRPILLLLAIMAGCAAMAGVVGHFAASQHLVTLSEPLASSVRHTSMWHF